MQTSFRHDVIPSAVLATINTVRSSAAFLNRSLRDLYDELRTYEERLGTPSETDGDLDRVRALAHEINNRITVHVLRAETTQTGITPAHFLAALCNPQAAA